MFLNNFHHELRTYGRSRWTLLIIVLFFGLTFFALHNGAEIVAERQLSIDEEVQRMDSLDAFRAARILAIEENREAPPPPEESWRDPRDLWDMAYNTRRVIAMEPQPLTLIAAGQSDLFPHVVKPHIYKEDYRLEFSELANPVQLLFGTFDLAFVCIYLLPLLVLALSFNVLSSARESGILPLIAAQPISLYGWLLQKLFIRFLLLSLLVLVAILVGLGLQGVNLTDNLPSLSLLLGALLTYMLFWFGVAFAVNLLGQPSGTNAITLVALWLGIVLFIPTIIAQTTNTLNPIPSRVNIIHEYREAYSGAVKNIDKIMDAYLLDHPELDTQDESVENRYGFMLRTFASAGVINEAIDPVLNAHQAALDKQQAWVNQLTVLSPALLLQKVFNQTAGTTTAHYVDFRRQIIDFTEKWKAYLKPRMFANEYLQSGDFEAFPRYEYSTEQVPSYFGQLLLLLVSFTLLAGGISFLIYQSKQGNLVIT
ncbi:MAG: DUF3526 domain-containing protein [Bacteroidota bacterium]